MAGTGRAAVPVRARQWRGDHGRARAVPRRWQAARAAWWAGSTARELGRRLLREPAGPSACWASVARQRAGLGPKSAQRAVYFFFYFFSRFISIIFK